MNRSTPGLKVSKAIPGFLQYKSAEALSPSTLESYRKHLEQWFAYLGDKDVKKITPQEIRAYLVWLQTEYKPHRFGGNEQRLSPKTVHNVWISLSAFFSWANREFNFPSPMKMVSRPKFEVALIEPFTKEEIQVLLTACDYSHEAKTDRCRKFVMRCFTAYRDRAVILFLLDTGLRSSELCALKIGDVDQKTGKVTIKHGATGGAKGKKGRVVYMGKSTRRALWRYLATREDADDSETSLFLGKFYRPLNKGVLRQLLARLGDKAKVVKVHPHRFRHTFAITYLRSNGDLFTLKALLGHSSLDMVQHYARIAQVDIEAAHRRASPADNWHL